MAANRSAGRDVHIYDAKHPDTVLGGLILTNGVTNTNFYSMVQVFLLFNSEYVLRYEDGTEVPRDEHALRPGKYYVVTIGRYLLISKYSGADAEFIAGTITANNEPWLVRTTSVASGTRVAEFRDVVRQRDRGCVITGEEAEAQYDMWLGFEAARIFPLAYEDHWVRHDYGRWISIPPRSGGSINSVQNGLLLRADIHTLFDNYVLSINPDVCVVLLC